MTDAARFPHARAQGATVGTQMRAIARLAVPVMFARAGLLVMAFVATAFVGHAGATELAYFAIATAPQVMLLTLGIGLMLGTGVLTAQARGAERFTDCGRVWRIAVVVGGVYGLVASAVLALGEDFLLLFGQPADLAAGGGRVLEMYALGMPVAVLFVATSLFLEGIGRPRVGMVIVVLGNVVNALACWILVEGRFGLPAQGAAGGAIGFSAARWFMVVLIVGYVVAQTSLRRYGVVDSLAGAGHLTRRLLAIGAPMAIALGLESAAFALVAGFAGRLGALPVAAYQIATNVLAIVFMLSVGIGTATTVIGAQAVGRGDVRAAAITGWAGLVLVLGTTAAVGAAIHAFAGTVTAAYTSDPRLIPVATAALGVTAAMVVVDGGQGVMISALRSFGDAVSPCLVYAGAFWALGVPLAWLAGNRLGLGLDGLLWSLWAALALATVGLAARYARLTRRRLATAHGARIT
ncbi:MAG: MATE family efflux transporter [Alphaproteobacteria bacterium]